MATVSKDVRALQSGAASGAARDDARLVAALRAGEEGAFARLVTDYQTAIYNLAWRLVHDREDARDIAQEVFLKAYRQIPRIEGELHLWAWLYRVTVNACWDHLRAGSRRPILLDDPGVAADQKAGDGEDQAEMARLFSASLAQLPPKQQAALLLKDVHGLQHSDIAAALGISRGSSEVLLFRARRSFRTAFTSLTADGGHEPACGFAEQAAAYSVGGRLTEARRRRVLEHARTCADCRKTVDRWSGAHAVGLGLALPLVAAPQLFGVHVAAAAATNLAASAASAATNLAASGASAAASAGASTAAASAGASTVASAGASTAVSAGASTAVSTALAAGGSSVVSGLTAKLAGLGIAKAAVVALAATAVVTYGGATAYKDYAKDGGRRAPSAAAAGAATHGVRASVSPRPTAVEPVVAALAAMRRTPVASDRRRPRPPAVRRFLALAALRARDLPGRALGPGPAARRVPALDEQDPVRSVEDHDPGRSAASPCVHA
ncbi:MAG: sigma-70 family RNA polymerase sigma factor, partial [Actinomycetes bacterium]